MTNNDARPGRALRRWMQVIVGTVLAIEVGRGILLDTYMIARGIHVGGYLVWIAIHSVVLAIGLRALRVEGSPLEAAPVRS